MKPPKARKVKVLTPNPAEEKMVKAYMALRHVRIMEQFTPKGYDILPIRIGVERLEDGNA